MMTSKKFLRVAEWNCNSITPRSLELQELLTFHNVDVLALTELKLCSSADFPLPPGYRVICNCRNRHGGGVALLVKDFISLKNLELPKISEDDNCELISADVYLSESFQFKLTCAYIPDGFKSWDNAVVLATMGSERSILCGDFNAHDPEIPENCSRAYNTSGKRVKEILKNNPDITLLSNGESTHVNGGQTDLWMCSTNMRSRVLKDVKISGHYHSDHFVSFVDIKVENGCVNSRFPKVRFQFNKADWGGYVKTLDELAKGIVIPDLVTEDTVSRIEFLSNEVSNITMLAAKKHIPVVPVAEVEKFKITEEMRKILRTEHKVSRLHLRNGRDPQLKSIARSLRENFEKCRIEAITRASRLKMKRLERERKVDPRKFYRIYRELTSKAQSTNVCSTLKDQSGRHVISERDRAEIFREWWVKQFNPRVEESLGERDEEITNHWEMVEAVAKDEVFRPLVNGPVAPTNRITREEMRHAVRKLKLKAPGIDEVSNLLIKKAGHRFLFKLRELYNLSLAVGHVPRCWKKAVIVNIPKPGKDHTDPSGYRPISLLNCIGKLLELILTFRLRDCFEKNNLIPQHQSGFFRNRGTQDQLFRLSQVASLCRLRKETFAAALLDFKGAFNAVWHDGLRAKLANCEHLEPAMKRWLSSFLNDRTFCVRVGHSFSETSEIHSGVPQGSALSPLLFIFFTADVIEDNSENHKAFTASYADDIAAFSFAVVPGLAEARVKAALRKIHRWTMLWRLPLGKEKCQVMKFWQGSRSYPIYLGDYKLEEVSSVRYLGLTFDDQLNWQQHFDTIIPDVKRRIACLASLGKLGASFETKRQVYVSLIRPVLEYGCVAYLTASEKQKNRLYKLQNQALRIIAGVRLEDKVRIQDLEIRCRVSSLWDRWLHLSTNFANRCLQQVPSVGDLIRRHLKIGGLSGTPLGVIQKRLQL